MLRHVGGAGNENRILEAHGRFLLWLLRNDTAGVHGLAIFLKYFFRMAKREKI
jgi:hypothetical protein